MMQQYCHPAPVDFSSYKVPFLPQKFVNFYFDTFQTWQKDSLFTRTLLVGLHDLYHLVLI